MIKFVELCIGAFAMTAVAAASWVIGLLMGFALGKLTSSTKIASVVGRQLAPQAPARTAAAVPAGQPSKEP